MPGKDSNAGGAAGRAAGLSLEQRPVTSLRGVGTALAAKLGKLGIQTVQDLLFLLPLRYEDRTCVMPIGTLRAGERAVIEAEVQHSEIVYRGRRQLLCRITDGSGFLMLRFFHFSGAQQQNLARGVRLRCFGELRHGTSGLEMVHPEHRRVEPGAVNTMAESLTPVYPLTEGLPQGRLRQLVSLALEEMTPHSLIECLPTQMLTELDWPVLHAAVRYLHHPPREASLELLASGRHPAQRRLAFEELLAHQLSLRQLRRDTQRDAAWPLPPTGALTSRLLASLPFELTRAQQRVWQDIQRDLAQPHPMLRLVQGDVGSGKTIVAALAAVRAAEAGMQSAVMAPTELLAEQHARNFAHWLEPLAVRMVMLSSKRAGATRKRALAELTSGEAQIAVGTHALFQADVAFQRLGLAIIDEQHRFGVEQRLLLKEKGVACGGRSPHQLIMTATPIPRTLAMTAYADLDLSVIDELPPGRVPVQTVALPESRRDTVVARIDQACRSGRQAYWVCPLVEQSDQLAAQAAEQTARELAEALQGLRVALVHGRMSGRDKDAVMQRFKAGEVDLLVATTVIEVGVDVPNASLMVVENAERMGLAQLHQLRGRVGRGATESTCVLLYHPPLSELARTRLGVMRATNDGFEIARRDLELRGPGELLGTRQTGLVQMRIADLIRDADLLPRVQRAAELMLTRNAANIAPLLRRWSGQGEKFGTV
jgi:ATP-dependent DNA helicase RecG